MLNQQFSEKASRLLDRINGISFHQKISKNNETITTNLNQTQPRKSIMTRTMNMNIASPQTQTILELVKIQQQMSQNEQQNCRKLKNLNEQIRKLEIYIKQETETRLKINQNFIHNIVKVQKNMHNALSNIRKIYSQRQKKLELKIDQILKQQKKQILEQIQSNNCLEEGMNRLKNTITTLNEQLVQMKRTRIQLEDKISKQFNDQIVDLKTVFTNTIKLRQERELKILEMLKNVYKKHIQSIRKQQIQRQASQKMFLTIIEQLIDRITQA